jgi:hypothetical protein
VKRLRPGGVQQFGRRQISWREHGRRWSTERAAPPGKGRAPGGVRLRYVSRCLPLPCLPTTHPGGAVAPGRPVVGGQVALIDPRFPSDRSSWAACATVRAWTSASS